jgi:iron-sulfur cluster assembly protein
MAISLTQSAASRVRKYLEARGEDAVGLRLGITKTGCSGYSYVINYADAVGESDVVFEDKGVRVVVDPEALALIDGTEVDFVKNGLNEAFSFRNPNVTGECGCGESFNV